MIDLKIFASTLLNKADEYGSKAIDKTNPAELAVMNGTASLILYAVVIALNDAQTIPEPDNEEPSP